MPAIHMRAWGKVRRFLLCQFRPDHVREQIKRRQGECRRCGDCCRIVFRCPFLRNDNFCAIYEKRFLACRMFPVDRRDVRDVPACAFRFDGAAKSHAADSEPAS